MFITCVLLIRPEGHQEPRSEVGSLSPAEHLVGFEPGTFRFLLQRLNPLGHSPWFQPAAKISNLEGWLKSDEEGGSFANANLNVMYNHFKEPFKVVAGDVDGL